MVKIKHYLSIMIIAVFSLAVCVAGDFNFDDCVGYYYDGIKIVTGQSIWQLITEYEATWIRTGRFLPLVIPYKCVVPYFLRNYCVYEAYIIFLTILDVWLLGKIIKNVSGSDLLSFLSMLMAVLCFQVYTTYHNPLVCYGGIYQVFVLLLLGEIFYYFEYLKKKNVYCIVAVLFLETAVCLFYEAGLLNVLFLVAILLFSRGKELKDYARLLFICSPSVIIFAVTMIIRCRVNSLYSGITPSLSNFGATTIKQLVMSFPLVHWFVVDKSIVKWNYGGAVAMILSFAVMLITYHSIVKENPMERIDIKRWLFAPTMGLLLFSMITAISQKYQQELYFGIAYNTVLFQWICMGIILALICYTILRCSKNQTKRKIFSMVLSAIVGMVFLFNFNDTLYNLEYLKVHVKYPKKILELALQNGICDDLESDDCLYTVNSAPWENEFFYAQNSKKRLRIDATSNVDLDNDKVNYAIKYSTCGENGAVLLGHVADIEGFICDSVYIYSNCPISIDCNGTFMEIEPDCVNQVCCENVAFDQVVVVYE